MKLAIAQKETILTVRQHREFKRRLAQSDKRQPEPEVSWDEVAKAIKAVKAAREAQGIKVTIVKAKRGAI